MFVLAKSNCLLGAHPLDGDHKGGIVALEEMAKSTCSYQLQWILLFDSNCQGNLESR